MFVICRVTATDYSPDADRENLQRIADELNRDARDEGSEDRWIVVQQAVVGDLFETGES